ncbi:MAG: hypothetical protein COZ12_04580 [Deltaproteobacteria bacterium CG_4_10_14_3_um_filter_60_8]|nr:MAG: hypothetical protein AUK28_02605 [Desulfobacterales bacterium CG2_30_60_27]PIP43655.1 MAG: hypothetical protein COX17_05875 [Deltaproteobacteria bacterium CG23_combo_of_CG06-09_8_20_14_all_60_8]PIY21475.1 MAG: hypothetical protein COZ12_04580 [Deltaproteobacteria bacterium CG_4_10_14_3_um_filter_60_8]
MTASNPIQPQGEKMRKAIRWISDTLRTHPEKTRHQAICEAEIRFDLSPEECRFLEENIE